MSAEKLNLIKACHREYEIALKLIAKARHHEEIANDDYDVWFNSNSGNVFLLNESDYRVFMLDHDDELFEFFTTPHSCHEGFIYELVSDDKKDWHHENIEYVFELLKSNPEYIIQFIESLGLDPLKATIPEEDCDLVSYITENVDEYEQLLELFPPNEELFNLIIKFDDKIDMLEKFVERMGISVPDDFADENDEYRDYNALLENVETFGNLLSLFKKKEGV